MTRKRSAVPPTSSPELKSKPTGDAPRAASAFPKSKRLRSRRDFAAMRRPVVRLESPCFRLSFRRADGDSARLGLAVSRKVGSAVVRNRIKRCVRELFRTLDLPAVDVLVMAKPGAKELARRSCAGVADELVPVLRQGAERARIRRRPKGKPR